MAVAMFPGQGSQSVGMGKDLYDNFSLSQRAFEEASDTLSINFKKLLFDGPEDQLQLTENAQPALLLTSFAAFAIIEDEYGFMPESSSGHSVGEFAAFVAAKVISFSYALKAVRLRGEAMQSAVPLGKGGMLAVMGLEAQKVHELCEYVVKQSGHAPLEVANYNTPQQTVISGNILAIEWILNNDLKEFLKTQKPKFIRLKVSAPFHCSMMKPAEKKLSHFFSNDTFETPRFPIVQNVTACASENTEDLKNNLIHQVSSPVRWVECVEQLKTTSSIGFEFGSGRVLQGLIKKISPDFKVISIGTTDDVRNFKNYEL